jgi:hypothetical protein
MARNSIKHQELSDSTWFVHEEKHLNRALVDTLVGYAGQSNLQSASAQSICNTIEPRRQK